MVGKQVSHRDALQHLRRHRGSLLLSKHLHAGGVAEHMGHAKDGRLFQVSRDGIMRSFKLLPFGITAIALHKWIKYKLESRSTGLLITTSG